MVHGGVCHAHDGDEDRVEERGSPDVAGLLVEVLAEAGCHGQCGNQRDEDDAGERLVGIEGDALGEEHTVLEDEPDQNAAHVGT